MDDCVPCAFLKPVVLHIAITCAGAFRLVVTDADDAAHQPFMRAFGIASFPQLLVFRDGVLTDRDAGYTAMTATRSFLTGALGLPDAGPADEADRRFRATLERAHARVEAIMEPASKALEPHVDALLAAQARIAEECAAMKRSGTWDEAAIGRWRAEELVRANAPIEQLLQDLRRAQAEGLAAFADMTALAVAATAPRADGGRVVCAPDGSYCEIVEA